MDKTIRDSLEEDVRKLIDKYENLFNYQEDLKYTARVHIVHNIISTNLQVLRRAEINKKIVKNK